MPIWLFSGAELTRCASDGLQCCTSSYIEMVEREVREELQEFLADEFEDVIDDYLDDLENLIECKSIQYSAIQTCTA